MSTLIVFASRRGSTKKAAIILQEALQEAGHPALVLPCSEVTLDQITQASCLILGSSTWGSGDLHEDFWPLEKQLKTLDLRGKTGAAFGCGNSSYPSFCWASEILENLLRNQGAKILQKHLSIDTIGGFDPSEVWPWASSLASKV